MLAFEVQVYYLLMLVLLRDQLNTISNYKRDFLCVISTRKCRVRERKTVWVKHFVKLYFSSRRIYRNLRFWGLDFDILKSGVNTRLVPRSSKLQETGRYPYTNKGRVLVYLSGGGWGGISRVVLEIHLECSPVHATSLIFEKELIQLRGER